MAQMNMIHAMYDLGEVKYSPSLGISPWRGLKSYSGAAGLAGRGDAEMSFQRMARGLWISMSRLIENNVIRRVTEQTHHWGSHNGGCQWYKALNNQKTGS